MKRFVDSVARQKGIKPPPGYTKSGSICRAFLDRTRAQESLAVPRRGEPGSKSASPAQLWLADKIAREKGIVILDETKASSAAGSAWICGEPRAPSAAKAVAGAPTSRQGQLRLDRRRRRRDDGNAEWMSLPLHWLPRSQTRLHTRLRIPYGNKEVALKLAPAIGRVDGMPHLE